MSYLNESINFVLSRWPEGQELSFEEIRELMMTQAGISLYPTDYQKILKEAVSQKLLEITPDAKYKKVIENKAQS